MSEFWADIRSFHNYEVSTEGRIRNKVTGRILQPVDNRAGSLIVVLRKGGGGWPKQVRRLVAESFLEVPNFGDDTLDVVVRHMDGDYENCRVENLVYDLRYNVQWRIRHPRKDRPVRIIEIDEVFDSVVECAQYVRGSDVMVERAIMDDEMSYKGYHYEWA